MSSASLPPQIGGRYRPIRQIGKGGMGVVYEVEHLHTGQRLALKLLSSKLGDSVERFKREMRAASRIKNDHVVRVTDADVAPELGDAPFLVMELLDGADLERATGDRAADPADVVLWLRQVAQAIAKAHEAGIVHRDLKPENLFLTRREDGAPLVKILDFGIAKVASEVGGLTASDAFLGTPGYMAPEQTDSRGPPVTFRADLYALGLIAFRLLTGRSYWKSGSLAQLLAQILADPMPPASERGSTFGPAFDVWFQRACARDAESRFTSATEEVDALAEALGLPAEPAAVSHRGRMASAPAATDNQGPPSLNASFTDLTTVRKRAARRRLVGLAAATAVGATGIVLALTRAGLTVQQRSSAAPREVAVAPLQAAVAEPAAPAVASSGVEGTAPPATPSKVPADPAAAAASPSAKRSPPAAIRKQAMVDAGAPKDPLEGPW